MRTIQRDIVGAFIFSKDGKFLIGKSTKGGVYEDQWIIPGGGVEEGETKPDALKREILEETGLVLSESMIRQMSETGSGESEKTLRESGERVHVKMQFYNFVVTLPEAAKDVQLKTDDDFTSPRWITADEMKTVNLSSPTITTLKILGYF